MIKVIRKKQSVDLMTSTSNSNNSPRVVLHYDDEHPRLSDAIKNRIIITYNENGTPDITMVDLGLQWDNRVTWLEFNLDKLLWGQSNQPNLTQEELYNLYNYKLIVQKPDQTKETYGFDGHLFEIKRDITSVVGNYSFILVIEEIQEDNDAYEGNIDDQENLSDTKERFITESFSGRVKESVYDPTVGIAISEFDTDQFKSLIKPSCNCVLTNQGQLSVSNTNIGVKFDNLVKFIRFNKGELSNDLNYLYLLIGYKLEDKTIFATLEPSDNYNENDLKEWISWIPSDLFQQAGKAQMFIIGFLGEENNEALDDFYFFVSDNITLTIKDNFLTEEDLTTDKHLFIILTSSNDEEIITKDNEIFVIRDGGAK